jgi:hypothetical protein
MCAFLLCYCMMYDGIMGVTRALPLQRLENLRGELYETFQRSERAFTVFLGLRFVDWYERRSLRLCSAGKYLTGRPC